MPSAQGLICEPHLDIPFPMGVFEPAAPTPPPANRPNTHRLSTQLLQVHRDATQAFLDNDDESAWASTIHQMFAAIHEECDGVPVCTRRMNLALYVMAGTSLLQWRAMVPWTYANAVPHPGRASKPTNSISRKTYQRHTKPLTLC